MGISRILTGTKDEFLAHLEEQGQEHLTAAKGASKDEAARQKGIAEGIDLATAAVRDWQQPGENVPANGKPAAKEPAWGTTGS
jgi:hypothetical protein